LCFSMCFLSLSLLYVVFSLLSKLLLMGPDGESFYSSPSCQLSRICFLLLLIVCSEYIYQIHLIHSVMKIY
jgi:hypothetical protein